MKIDNNDRIGIAVAICVVMAAGCGSRVGDQCGGAAGTLCGLGQFCKLEEGLCGEAEAAGVCEVVPVTCTLEFAPVCGCDGETYSNECGAAAAGVSIDHQGECEGEVCGGIAGLPCEAGSYCKLEEGNCCCDLQGVCEAIPEACAEIFDPVCGCDGETYGNACEAAAAGVNIDLPGECPLPGCAQNEDCADGEYCLNDLGECEGQGTCVDKPDGCVTVVDPVCGCDGVTYGNACEAALAGVSIASPGECEPEFCGGLVGLGCSKGDSYCKYEVGSCCCDFLGVCTPRPEACSEVIDFVCGCNGKTYGNACLAAKTSVAVDFLGECPLPGCAQNEDCADGEYCLKDLGECEGQGTCVDKPDGCVTVVDPVCGCDGVTYGNACEAAVAGMSIASPGECPTMVCIQNEDCPNGEYCLKDLGVCDGRGTCVNKPDGCVLVVDPVCGCDGVTYGNACEAALAGVTIESEGICP